MFCFVNRNIYNNFDLLKQCTLRLIVESYITSFDLGYKYDELLLLLTIPITVYIPILGAPCFSIQRRLIPRIVSKHCSDHRGIISVASTFAVVIAAKYLNINDKVFYIVDSVDVMFDLLRILIRR